jgi:hypothetical protein
MDPQVQEIFTQVVTALGTLMVACTAIVGFFNGPTADKVRGIFDTILSFARMFGFGTYKDEPGTLSVPLKKDTGERIVTTETV